MRKADPRGDLGRVERQREVIMKTLAQAADVWTVVLPWRWKALNEAIFSSLTLGEDTGVLSMFRAASGGLDFASGNALQLTVPISDPDFYTDWGASAVLWDEELSAQLFAEIAAGDTSKLDRFAN
jgi:anionic cell wall polymer biosynthesis LytR-Cps2A-Psr (LCP) family protein